MQGLKGQSTLLVSILLSLSAITSANTIAQTCQLVPNNTYIADPSNCAGFAFCVNGQPNDVAQCLNGKLYNSQTGLCSLAKDVTCASANMNSICKGLNGVFKADPTNCQNFCYCQNDVADCFQCANGLVFNPTTAICIAASTYACAVGSPCALVPNNVPVRDVASCSSYYVCSKGIGVKKTCSNGFLYNALKGACDHLPNVDCKPTSIPVPGSPKCAKLSVGQLLVTDGETCQGYFNCANGASTVEPVHQECPKGSHFNQSLQKCVSPHLVACPYNRCGGLTYKFVTALNSNCRDYYVCKNGETKWESKASCPPNFPYLDESRTGQPCVPNKPSHAVCV